MGRIAAVTNLILGVLKIVGGFMTGSIALIGDGVHSLADMVTDFIIMLAAPLGARPADRTHPYGHGKFETLAALIISLAILGAGVEIGWKSLGPLLRGEQFRPGPAVLVIAAISVATNEWLYRRARRVGEETRSGALLATAWHHRSDALSSIVVLIAGAVGMAGWGYADQVGGLIVAVMVSVVGIRFGRDAIAELLEESAGSDTEKKIGEILDRIDELRGWHKLRTRRVGRELFVDMHVVVVPSMTVAEADQVAHVVEDRIRDELGQPCNVIVHVDPDCRGEERGESG